MHEGGTMPGVGDILTVLGLAALCGVWVLVQRWSARAPRSEETEPIAHDCGLCPEDDCHVRDALPARDRE